MGSIALIINIWYLNEAIKAAELFSKNFPNEPMTVLVDYFGKEITDSLNVAEKFPDLVKNGFLSLRLDTHGGRFVEGLDTQKSYAVLERNVPSAVRGYRTESELKDLIGTGVSAASIWHLRENLDKNGFQNVKITASSGFDPDKCRVFSFAKTQKLDTAKAEKQLPEDSFE